MIALIVVTGSSFFAATQERFLSAQEAFNHPAFEIMAKCYQMCRFDHFV